MSYKPNQIKSEYPYIIIKGIEFSKENNSVCWQRVRTPHWDYKIITPKIVREIVEWSLTSKDNLIIVDIFGR